MGPPQAKGIVSSDGPRESRRSEPFPIRAPLRRFSAELEGEAFTTYVEEGTKLIAALKQLARENGGYVLLKHYKEMDAWEIVAIKIGDRYLVKGQIKALKEADYSGIRDAEDEMRHLISKVGSQNKGHGIHFWVGSDGIPLAIEGASPSRSLEEHKIGFPNAFELEVRGKMDSFRFGLADENFNPLNLKHMDERYKGSGGLKLSSGMRELLEREGSRPERSGGMALAQKAVAAHADSRGEVLLPDTTVILDMRSGEIFTEHEIGAQATGFDAAPFKLQRLMLQDLRIERMAPEQAWMLNDGMRIRSPLWGRDGFDLRQGIGHRRLLESSSKTTEDGSPASAQASSVASEPTLLRHLPLKAKSPASYDDGDICARKAEGHARKWDARAAPCKIEPPIAQRMPPPASGPSAAGSDREVSLSILLMPRRQVAHEPLRSIFRARSAPAHDMRLQMRMTKEDEMRHPAAPNHPHLPAGQEQKLARPDPSAGKGLSNPPGTMAHCPRRPRTGPAPGAGSEAGRKGKTAPIRSRLRRAMGIRGKAPPDPKRKADGALAPEPRRKAKRTPPRAPKMGHPSSMTISRLRKKRPGTSSVYAPAGASPARSKSGRRPRSEAPTPSKGVKAGERSEIRRICRTARASSGKRPAKARRSYPISVLLLPSGGKKRRQALPFSGRARAGNSSGRRRASRI